MRIALRKKASAASRSRVGVSRKSTVCNGKAKGQEWIEENLGWTTQTVKPPPRRVLVLAHVEPAPRPAFTVLPRRWVVERTFVWLGQSRRLNKDYERLYESSEALIYATMSRLMVRRLARM